MMRYFLMLCLFWITTGQAFSQVLDNSNNRLWFNDHGEALTCVSYNDNNMPWNGYWTYTGGTQNTCNQSSTNNVTLSSTYKRSGTYSYRHFVQYTGSNDGAYGRGEWGVLSPAVQTLTNEWRWAAISILIGPNHSFESRRYQIGFDHKEVPDNLETPFWLGIFGYAGDGNNGPRYGIAGRYVEGSGNAYVDLGPVTTGIWVDWLLERNWKTDNTGYMRFYKNGVQVWERINQPNTVSSVSPICRVQQGLYKWAWYSGNPEGGPGGGSPFGNLEIYTDEIKYGKTNATFADMQAGDPEGPPTNQSPTANAGANQQITLPTSTATLSGSGSDVDGSIASYAWTKVSGPTGGTIAAPTSASTGISALQAGTYIFRLTVTDDDGATGTDEVTITVVTAPPAGTNPYIVDASGNSPYNLPDRSITNPASTDTVRWHAKDDDGWMTTMHIVLISKPGGADPTINWYQQGDYGDYHLNYVLTSITGLSTNGTYVFQCVGTDNSSNVVRDTFNIVRNAAVSNVAPVAIAGNDTTVVFGDFPGTSSVKLNGDGTDSDGTIASYFWEIVSGTGGTIVNPNVDTAVISANLAGVFVLRLTVTDDDGATDTDDRTIVFAQCDAGADQSLAYTITSTTLSGSTINVSDTANVTWTKISGTGGTIVESGKLNTSVTGLTHGEYVFELHVEYDDGTDVYDRVRVVIAAAPITTTNSYRVIRGN